MSEKSAASSSSCMIFPRRKGDEKKPLPEVALNGFLIPDSRQPLMNEAWTILETATVHFQPTHIFFLLSGGYDSFVTTHLSNRLIEDTLRKYASTLPQAPAVHVLHINTGIGIPQTREFVREVVGYYAWNYLEYATPESYEENVLAYGFPGPSMHTKMYILLKERALRLAIRDHTPPHPLELHKQELYGLFNDMQPLPLQYQYVIVHLVRSYLTKAIKAYREGLRPMLFVTGVRRQESTRRMGNVIPMQKHGRHWWLSPLTSWSKGDILDYMEAHQMPHNPVVDTLHKSSECLCGAFAHAGELEEICTWYPEVGAYIKHLEQRVRANGFPWSWEEGPPKWWRQACKGQLMLPGFEEYTFATQEEQTSQRHFSPLCSSCQASQEVREGSSRLVPPSTGG